MSGVKLTGLFRAQPKAATALEAFVLAVAIGYIDYITGWETSLFIFYAVPIFFVTWYGDRRSGIVFAILCGAIWFVANYETQPYHTPEGYAWATVNRAIYFAFVAFGSTAMRLQREEARARIEAMTRTRELEQELVRASEREQMRIGQDLHDGVCQSLAAIDCATQCLKTELESARLPHASSAAVIQKMLRDTVVEARSLARGLFPVQMESHGLPAALQDLVATTNQLRHTSVSFAATGDIRVENRETAIHLYRIAQEALSNAVRHGHANHITVSLTEDHRHLVMTIDDDGRGISATNEVANGMGLRTMRYRAQVIDATLDVISKPSGGTSIRCALTLPS
ncbi:MAG: sensor histidine kinase [Chthoniobacteraceae bacterium]